MGQDGALGAAVACLLVIIAIVCWCAVEFVVRSGQVARRPLLPPDDRPPAGLTALRAAEIPAEVDAGLAALIGHLRRRTLHS